MASEGTRRKNKSGLGLDFLPGCVVSSVTKFPQFL